MRRKKKSVELMEGDVLIGFGHRTAIKYVVLQRHEKGIGWMVQTVGEKPKSTFHYKSDIFTNGTTLYKNGLRCYLCNKVKDRQYQGIKSRQAVISKLNKLQAIIDWSKNASDARILELDNLLNAFLDGYNNSVKSKRYGTKY